MHKLYIRIFCLLAGLIIGAAGTAQAAGKKLIVLGIDGMDPNYLQGYIDEGIAPNLEKLAERGGFMPLGTSVPPQSPVAWSNLTTGMNPGGHGLFDFLALDRETMLPYMSSVRVVRTLDWGTLDFGEWEFPIVVEQPELLRDGKAFWEILEDNKVTTRVFRMPANYPPTTTGNGKAISGMGTPDLKGTSGTFGFYTDDPAIDVGPVSGGEVIRVSMRNNEVRTVLKGPANVFREGNPDTELAFSLKMNPATGVATITIGAETAQLKVGEWSDWIAVDFNFVPYLVSLNGMVRFYLKETEPNFRLYVTPINIDPRAAAQPISQPPEYAYELAESAGPFYTQEMPEDTKALSARVLTPEEFLDQSGLVLAERRRLLEYELGQFKKQPSDAYMFFYVDSLDLRNHMLARQMDPDHPYHEPDTPERMVNAMRTTYTEIDQMVGYVLDNMADDMDLVVMSDHGFASFRTQVNLNTWLEQNGYLALKDPAKRDEYEWLDGIDWTKTRAFAIGLNSLYINVQGRERDGIVSPAEREALAREIVAKLAEWKDPETGERIVTQPLAREDIYSGPHVANAPDVLVGYAKGYRSSWATTSGETPAELLEPNINEWSGDHCMDSATVPGVLLATKPMLREQADLKDLTAAILGYYGVTAPQVEGKPAF